MLAHALGVECRLTNGKVQVKAFYDNGTRAAKASVLVTDRGGTTVASGETDAAGLWAFDKPPVGRYIVIVDAGDGHRAEETLEIRPESAAGSKVSSGPSEEEFTRFPWVKVAIGLAAIAGFAVIVWLVRRGDASRIRGEPPM